MNCEVQHLAKNIRYRILVINDEHYILDMERSFWKIIFPFLFWIVPTSIFKLEDQDIAKQLKAPKRKKTDGALLISLGGFAYVLGILLTPLMDYFEIRSSLLVNTILLIIALILVTLLYLSISHTRKKNLIDVVEPKKLQQNIVRIRPKSIKHIFKVMMVYTWFLGLNLFFFIGFIEIRNIMLLIFVSAFLFVLLLSSRITVEEGNTTVRFNE
ncbi:DUF443 family protein [Oceanobacillus jeddahense]|uniref:DUF443 domain-containing protein n=1 Tax=Oceanobacillus jeddahense TaxID=1462527 RepID=A0ABY5JXT9_9BACI|nr:DUF443 family protein [Oceanobacillus jeddahense]UUI05210.1 DUF443 domain-containing protein [Oceanobacillus jeddahense]